MSLYDVRFGSLRLKYLLHRWGDDTVNAVFERGNTQVEANAPLPASMNPADFKWTVNETYYRKMTKDEWAEYIAAHPEDEYDPDSKHRTTIKVPTPERLAGHVLHALNWLCARQPLAVAGHLVSRLHDECWSWENLKRDTWHGVAGQLAGLEPVPALPEMTLTSEQGKACRVLSPFGREYVLHVPHDSPNVLGWSPSVNTEKRIFGNQYMQKEVDELFTPAEQAKVFAFVEEHQCELDAARAVHRRNNALWKSLNVVPLNSEGYDRKAPIQEAA